MPDFFRRTGLLSATAYVVANSAPTATVRQARILKARYGDLIQICSGTPAGDRASVQTAINTINTFGGGKLVMIGGIIYTDGVLINLCSNLILEFAGSKLKLVDGGVQQGAILGSSALNITIINPCVDEDRLNNTVEPTGGSQEFILLTASSRNVNIFGGFWENLRQNGVWAATRSLKWYGTKLSEVGEHGLYASGGDGCANCEDVWCRGVEVYHPGRMGRGYGFKFSGVRNGNLDECYTEFVGDEGYTTYGFVYTTGCQGGHANIRVENADGGFQIGSKDASGRPNRGIKVNIHMVNCDVLAGRPVAADDNEEITVEGFWETAGGIVYCDAFGSPSIIRVRNAIQFHVDDAGHLADIILEKCDAIGSAWPLDIRKANLLKIVDSEFTCTSGTTGNCASIRNITTKLELLGLNRFIGGKVYSLMLFSSGNKPTQSLIEGSDFNIPGVLNPTTGVYIYDLGGGQMILQANNIRGGKISGAGVAQAKKYDNVGYVTCNSGTFTIPNGSTFVKVTHGLAAIPTRVLITLTSSLGAASEIFVSNKDIDGDGTKFQVNVDINPGADVTGDWKAMVGEGI